jgi:hypothetical protein
LQELLPFVVGQSSQGGQLSSRDSAECAMT